MTRPTIYLVIASGFLAACTTDKGERASAVGTVVMAEVGEEKGISPSERSAATRTAALTRDGASRSRGIIQVGESVSGELTAGDQYLSGTTRYDAWELELDGETGIEILMESSDFDTYLVLAAGQASAWGTLQEDDDGGGGTNSRIRATLEAGRYVVLASSYAGGETGRYQLTVGRTDGSGGGVLRPGMPVVSTLDESDPLLDDGRFVEAWTIRGREGDVVSLSMDSDAVDAFLILARPLANGFAVLAEDDDGGTGWNSFLEEQLPETGDFVVLATTYGTGDRGEYSLEMSVRRLPEVDWEARFPGGGDPADSYALLVGISDYPGGGNDLRAPEFDVQIVREALVNGLGYRPENVVTLVNEEATRGAIANAFARHLGQAGSEGSAVFYFSGHGTQLEANLGLVAPIDEEDDGVDEGLTVWGLNEGASMLLDDEIGFLTNQLGAGRITLIVDACHSGTISRGALSRSIPTSYLTMSDLGFQAPRAFVTEELQVDTDWFTSDSEPIRSIDGFLPVDRRTVLLAASTEAQLAYEVEAGALGDTPIGLFTHALAAEMSDLRANQSLTDLHRGVLSRLQDFYDSIDDDFPTQDPQLLTANPAARARDWVGGN